jgi:SAM-dependent methyltransferase
MQQEQHNTSSTQQSYDRAASAYANTYLHEFDHKPADRELLDRFAERVKAKGRVLDLGCGPGQVARYLHDRGVDAFGMDLSPEMVEQARKAHPGMEFVQGDMRSPDLPDDSLAGITAFYSLIHLPREHVSPVVRRWRSVLQPGGLMLVAFHKGDYVHHADQLLDVPVSLDFTFFDPKEMEIHLRAGGFLIDAVVERDPYVEVEYPSRRVYILARRPELHPQDDNVPVRPQHAPV